MNSITETIEVLCLICGERYTDWYRSSLDAPSGTVCPYCGYDPAKDWLPHEEGVDFLGDDEENATPR